MKVCEKDEEKIQFFYAPIYLLRNSSKGTKKMTEEDEQDLRDASGNF